ncbi:MAG: ABC transporter ATP-binding protein, partial [Limnochordia bacterium]|nr:ABC transporter ATP-binding protein [Limnochordia bacterium]
VLKPIFLVADEPVSMLDVSVRAGILNLMKEISQKMQLTTVYISHDLSLLQYLCDHTIIMYLGQIVEYGKTETILKRPLHPYSQALVAAIPTLNGAKRQGEILLGNHVPSPIDLPEGCLLQGRCPHVTEGCRGSEQVLTDVGGGHLVRCALVKVKGGKAG